MNLWDEITVRIYALIHVKEYRHKVAEDTVIFLSALAAILVVFETTVR